MGPESREAVSLFQNGQAMLEQAAEVQREHVLEAQDFLAEIINAIVS